MLDGKEMRKGKKTNVSEHMYKNDKNVHIKISMNYS